MEYFGCCEISAGAYFFAVGIAEGELQRLRYGVLADDSQLEPFLVRIRFTAKDPIRVIANARAVLIRVVERTSDWPAFELWPELLPAWFLQRCAPEPGSRFDVEAWLRQWRAMTPEEKSATSQQQWMLSNWLYYFDPSDKGLGNDRSWWWWDAGTDEPTTGWVDVATTGWPFGSGSLRWLIEASGGTDLAYEA